ncbi:diphosphomevalonate decarboxylase [Lacticaseibacillus paracasei]|uniref:diphosphomevalonate decarboxylase n=1 Tax=Lacticaseibacillus paracasei TaxID=1597 RepID=UPI002ADEAED3|nr:diphosphomevalonate decarboxylase [Lacticaseibacillus paracasei]MEA0971991.1 diphosphomevalonate decarboxylase [Lacticaseibacillus paracasei]
MTTYARAHTNIALIKYWGKANRKLMLPATSSISLTLNDFYTDTAVTFDPSLNNDRFMLNGEEQNPVAVSLFLDRVRHLGKISTYAQVTSLNHVPTAAGLASSASAFAALATAASRAAGLSLSPTELSRLARRGSGSATRSIFGGAVIWHRGHDDASSFAEPLAIQPSLPLRMLVVTVSAEKKAVSSRKGMANTVATSPYYDAWVASNESLIEPMITALAEDDLALIGKLTELSSMRMHAAIMAEEPPFTYFLPETLRAWQLVQEQRALGIPAFATMDAGPNVKILTTEPYVDILLTALRPVFGDRILSTRLGPDASIITKEQFDDTKSAIASQR